ncbi:MAG: hypothetical protein FVQ77_04260 [Cytophagales bacterium]|nr:hypothetical protein [Cytophagales bacterium]
MEDTTTQNQTNWGRVISGGIAAGIGMSIIGWLINDFLLGKYYTYFATREPCPSMLSEPAYLGEWAFPVLSILAGIGIAYLYTLARNGCCGPGPKTALCLGIVIGLLMGVPSSTGALMYADLGRAIPLGWMLDSLLQAIAGALIAGAIYKPKA